MLRFWNWFADKAIQLQVSNLDPDTLAELDKRILNWKLTWEIGPGEKTKNSLCISPNGNKAFSGDTEEIISHAPKLTDWEFYSYKQPKKAWAKVYLHDQQLAIDATDWTYVLLAYPDNKIECIVKAENMSALDEQTKTLAADIVLTNLLGEKSNITDISFVDIIAEYDDPTYFEKAGSIKNLPAHLLSLGEGA